jgi:pSer/pThr/pTyr-binding forkhead associated (FHA) protein
MPTRLVALDEGPDIALDRDMVVVGRHPNCDTRLDSLRVSRHHCCMTQESGEVVVRDLGSTNGIRINGQRVEMGRLRAGDELSIAHIRYRLEDGESHDQSIAPPSVSMKRWIWIRPGTWGFGPVNEG